MEIVGRAPELAGLQCEAFICQAFVYKGELASNAHVVYLCFAGEWQTLSIDCGVIFWRRSVGRPEPWMVASEGWEYPHVDVGAIADVIGQRLKNYRMAANGSEGQVMFLFDNGRTIAINNENDVSTFQIG
ncbi:MAG: hypothetical protein V4517_25090 [Pseudomonadota bacterium]